MKRVLRIGATDGFVPPFDKVLTALGPKARELHWSVLDLGDATGGEGWDHHLPYEEKRVLESGRGWLLSFDELTAWAEWVGQVIDGIFVGCSSRDDLPERSYDDLTILRNADIVVAAIDSTFWAVSGPDDTIEHIRQAFPEAREVEVDSVLPLSTWGRDY